MRKQYIIFLLAILFLAIDGSQAQGLKFRGNKYPIEERTSYNVFNNRAPTFNDSLNIKFDIQFDNIGQLGYLFRLKSKKSNLTLNLAYDSQGDHIVYYLNLEGKSRLITIAVPKSEYAFNQWVPLKVDLDMLGDRITFSLGKYSETHNLDFPPELSLDVLFGCSDYFIDVPEYAIRNLKITSKNKSYEYPLKEHTGTVVVPTKGGLDGSVVNPVWMINDAYHWKYVGEQESKIAAGFNFNPIDQHLYYFNQDSIIVYNMASGHTYVEKYNNACPINIRLGDSFINTKNNSLVVYETYKTQDGDARGETPKMAEYSFDTKKWIVITNENLPTERHHHGRFFDEKNNRLIIFGGFGNLLYSNDFYSFDFNTRSWTNLKFKGDNISPRYFLSMGYIPDSNIVYIFGGMGNESGQYNVGRKYFYDLYKVDLNNYSIKKMWEIPWSNENIVPVKSMIINEEDKSFITFCYPEHYSNTYLKLYKFSIPSGAYQILGDSIPIRSDKIATNAGLFLNKQRNELYGIAQEFEEGDIESTFRLYSILYPPVSSDIYRSESILGRYNISWMYIVPISILILILVAFVWVKWKTRKEKRSMGMRLVDHEQATDIVDVNNKPNSIFLFGKYSIINRQGRDIEYMFSARLKHTFLLILQYSWNGGITSRQLTNMLWDDRNEKQAKNIRGVTINGLRKILEELDGISLIYEKSTYRIDVDNSCCYCDYLEYISLSEREVVKDKASEFIKILSKGKFLENEDDALFDSWKSSVEYKLEPQLKQCLERLYDKKDYKMTSILSKSVLKTYPLSNLVLSFLLKSLIRLGKEEQAKERYLEFVAEYKKMMGEDYKVQYEDLI